MVGRSGGITAGTLDYFGLLVAASVFALGSASVPFTSGLVIASRISVNSCSLH